MKTDSDVCDKSSAVCEIQCGRWRLARKIGQGAYGVAYFAVGPGGTHASDIYSLGLTLKAGKRDKELMASPEEEAKATASADDEAFEEREWQAAALEEALRRIKPEVNPEHYAAFVTNAIEGQDTETVMRLYELSRDKLYQIRKRLTAKIRETVASVLVEMDAPDAPG